MGDENDPGVLGTINSAAVMKYYWEQKGLKRKYHSPRITRKMMVKGRKLAQLIHTP